MNKAIIVFIALEAIIVKTTHSQCIRNPFEIEYSGPYSNFAYDGYHNSLPFSLGSFSLSSAFSSPYGPMSLFGNFPFSKITSTGSPRMSVLSDNVVEGLVSVTGRLPFISSVAINSTFPTVGTGYVDYNCGGLFGIFNELPGPVLGSIPVITPTFAPAVAPSCPAATYGYAPFGYDYYDSYGNIYEPYVGDIAYGNYEYGPYNYGSPISYDPIFIDGYSGGLY